MFSLVCRTYAYELFSDTDSYRILGGKYKLPSNICDKSHTTTTTNDYSVLPVCCWFLQDTVVALQALTVYGARDTNRALYNMEVELEHAETDFKRIVKLNKDNWSTLQVFDVSLS